jgi:hypothetical protein
MLAYFVESLPSPSLCLTRTLPLCVYPSLHCTDFVIVQLLPTSAIDIQGKPPHRPRRTLWSTDRNIPPRIPVRAPIPADGVARFNLSRAQATTLAGRLLDALEQNDQNPIEVPPAYDYGEEFAHIITEGLGIPPAIAAEGLGIRGGRRQRQN